MKDHVSLLGVRGRIGAAVGICGVLALGLAACSGGDADTPDPTVPTAVSTTPTTTAPDVSVIPDRIDEPYLNAVLAALDQVDGDAVRIIHATKRFPPDVADRLNAIYSDDRFQVQADGWLEALARDPKLSSIAENPGNRKTTVERIITATATCVFVAVKRDHSANAVTPAPPRTEYIALRPLDGSNDPKKHNPTAWMMTVDGFNPDGTEPVNPCVQSP